ncbi:MAG TPA: SRPBCC domain-containing protein [Candidatus Dormibacteraeota bacterium]|nr:SRPBCC domain-containing protein [Candidatus Dormibacteraeota bacterium]
MTERPRLTLERTFKASIEDVWELWTTREGIESWWGPEGFSVAVRELNLRPGGELVYAMSAVEPDQMEYMAKAGMPLITEHKLTFTDVDPPRRLAYKDLADFIPGVEPYEVRTVIELSEVVDGVRMVLTFDRMHDDEWTRLATMGRESELHRLEAVLAARQ